MQPDEPIRAVVFDMDGLMLNTEDLYQHVGGEVLRRRGKAFDAALKDQMMGRPGPIALQIMIDWHSLTDTPERLAEESSEVFRTILDAQLETMPGLLELLAALEQAGIPKAIATSSGRAFTENVLGRFDLAPRFEFQLTAEDITHGKPHPEIYQLAADRLGVSCATAMVLEDSAHGCRAAVDAGTYTVAVPTEHSHRHDFSGARFIAKTLRDRRIYRALAIEPGRAEAPGENQPD